MPERDLAGDPSARVIVFIDGQNLYKRCRDLFGSPHCHPNLLAQHLAGARGADRVDTRFYTARPDPNIDPRGARNLDRRLDGMRKAGVTVVFRPLRYHWDWAPSPAVPPARKDSEPRSATLKPWQRPREKGIDLVLALDVVEFALSGRWDVGIVVSLDRDLWEIPQALDNLNHLRARPFRLEAAVPVPEGLKQPKRLPRFAYTHQITREVFDLVRDRHDYAVDEDAWVRPTVPDRLATSAVSVEAPLPGMEDLRVAPPEADLAR